MSRFHAHYVAFVLDTANAAFEVVILSFPTVKPITATTMNYAAPITIGVMLLASGTSSPHTVTTTVRGPIWGPYTTGSTRTTSRFSRKSPTSRVMRSRKESSLGICRSDDGFAVFCVLGNAVFGFNRYKRVRGVVDTDPLGMIHSFSVVYDRVVHPTSSISLSFVYKRIKCRNTIPGSRTQLVPGDSG
jgi:hypothetical protein